MHAVKTGAWDEVLSHLISATGASAVMISLREGKTCQIVDDIALQQTYHSPLIKGFSPQQAFFYLSELRERDPWAKAQCFHYPTLPTLMSRIQHPSSSPDDPFFKWLSDLGIQETLVCELARATGYWTAINLFFSTPESPTALNAKRYLDQHIKALRDGWSASQTVVQSKQSFQASLDNINGPACIIDRFGHIVEKNKYFDDEVETPHIKIVGPRHKLTISDNLTYSGCKLPSALKRFHISSTATPRISLSVKRYASDPLYQDVGSYYFLIVFEPISDALSAIIQPAPHFLSAQEQRLLKHIKKGLSIKDAGAAIGVRRTRAFEIWASVKDKTGIANSHQVREPLTET